MQRRLLKLHFKRPQMMEDRGAAAVEYGLMVALIAIVILAVVEVIGTHLSAIFDTVASSL